MAFLRKKKVKFNVELVVQKLTDVPLLNAVIFAKVRLLEGGSFVGVTLHRPVCSHQVDFMSPSVSRRLNDSAPLNIRLRNRTNSGQFYSNAYVHRGNNKNNVLSPSSHKKFQQIERRHSLTERSPQPGTGIIYDHMKDELKEKQQQSVQQNLESDYFFDELGNLAYAEKNTQPFVFVCYIPYDSKYTGELEACRFKISLRKEDRAGRNPQKLGFVIINLSEFAGTGSTGVEKSFLLDGYVRTQRQDNSRVHIFIRMQHNSSDPLFKVPNSASLLFQQQNEIEDCHDQLGQWLNPIDRRAPSSSPNENIGLGSGVLNTVNSTTISSEAFTPITSIERRAPILNDALTTNETLAAGRNAFLMSHLFERINLKNKKQNETIEKEGKENLIFKECSPSIINNNQIESSTNNILENNNLKKIFDEQNNSLVILTTTTEIIENNFNESEDISNPFIFPPTELSFLQNNKQQVQYPLWLKIVFLCVIGFGIAFFLLMLLIGLITRCENATTTTTENIEENIVTIEGEQISSRPIGDQQIITDKKDISLNNNNKNNRIVPITSGSIVVIQGEGGQPSTSFASSSNYATNSTNLISSPPGFVN
ncbi:C2 NT-type domain-containing protein [Meloidogyne graminicola]|uniref:C2 NT-type domain-containing protein n=1 Tax=Meloidogyne graminicola TaxID=189291 RepID=A0A8S9ZNQ3_9BILA|nr:C2 NT-type domain-containing protein [Meloidogyne graminicola]